MPDVPGKGLRFETGHLFSTWQQAGSVVRQGRLKSFTPHLKSRSLGGSIKLWLAP
jgi:hypothetical protein